ncbi:multidrug efflux RND transporter permease subunit [Orrella sp. 11846]|uniref:multidrug efflux RND transporter permease subunit n=1 Tax=Orrella sp. 11846 TaxID=3409913 RepID=UPI003B5908DF
MSLFFAERPIFAWVVAILITLFGVLSVRMMPVSQYPDVAPPAIQISATYPGASSEEVSESVTSIIENELNGAKGLLYYESVSDSNGSSQITATFVPGTDPDQAQVDVQNRVSNVMAQLPDAVNQQGVKFEQTSAGFLMVVSLSSKDGTLDQTGLADYITRNVQNPISRVPGVGRFQLFASPRAMRIWIDPDKLTGLNISAQDISNALATQNILIPAGVLGGPPNPTSQRVTANIATNGQLSTVEEFENVIVRANTDGSNIRLRDVARVEVGADNYQFGARLNGHPTAAFAVILAPGANALQTAQGVIQQMEDLSKFFPGDIEFSIPYNTAPYIEVSIQQVIETLLEAMLLVFIVMFVFLQNLRYTVIPALVVPVAMMGAFAVMNALGFSVNVLTMFAMVLSIGILVDDAIVVVENVERIMAEEGLPPKEATIKAMPQISGAIVGITLVLVTVFLPLALMSGSVGVIYRQFAVAMAVSIAFSGFLALSFTPALCATILKPVPQDAGEKRGFFGWFNRTFNKTTRGYEKGVNHLIYRGGRYMVIYLALTVVMGLMYMKLPSSFLPEEDQGFLMVNIELPSGSSQTRTQEVVNVVEKYFLEQPQTENIVAVSGFSFNGNGLNAALAFVTLKPFDERRGPGDSAMAVAGKATGFLLGTIPDALVFAVIPPAITALGNSSGFDLRLQDRGGMGNMQLLAGAQELLQKAAQNPVLSQVRITGLSPGPTLNLKLNREKLAAQGVDFNEAASTLGAAIGGRYIGKFPNMGWMQNVWIQAEPTFRMDLEDLLRLNARNRAGEMVPLASFVEPSWDQGPTQVVRYNSYDAIRISGSAAPGYSSGEAMAAMEQLISELPDGFGYEWTGLSYQEVQAGAQAPMLLGLAILVVFLVLSALYESWAIPLSALLIVPLGMLGAVLMVTALGMESDVYFQVGMVTVIGLSTKNAILIVEFAKDLYGEGMDLFQATKEAARMRFRPILMTSFAFILGVMPLTLASGAGAASQKSVGFGVLGGMLAATPFAVIFVPIFFVVVLSVFKTKVKLFNKPFDEPGTQQTTTPTASASTGDHHG